jgi:hypothetical protein
MGAAEPPVLRTSPLLRGIKNIVICSIKFRGGEVFLSFVSLNKGDVADFGDRGFSGAGDARQACFHSFPPKIPPSWKKRVKNQLHPMKIMPYLK